MALDIWRRSRRVDYRYKSKTRTKTKVVLEDEAVAIEVKNDSGPISALASLLAL